MPTCFAWVGLDASLTLAPTGPTTTLQFALPNDPGLSSLAAYSQTAMLSAGVNTAGILTSKGLTITFGVQ